MTRRWKFLAIYDGDDDSFYLDAEGKRCHPDMVEEWIGLDWQAHEEAERRARLHEILTGQTVGVELESQGKVKE